MSATSTGSKPPASAGAPAKTRGSARGRWALLGVLIAAVALAGWIIWNARAQSAAGASGGGGGGGRGGGRGGFGGATSVNAARTTTGDMPVYIDALGTVTPPATVTVRTQVAGQLLDVSFREGQDVTKGQLLAQVDPRPYQAALSQAQGALARDQAQLANARLDLTRYTTLLSQDSIARQTVDTQRATVRQLEGTVEADRGAVQSARVNLGYTRITAPVSGRVGLRQVDPGNYVSNGDSNGLVTITTIHPIDAVFTVPEDEVGTVMARSGGGARLAATAFDRTNAVALDEGYLLTLDNQIDTTTGTVKAKARFPNSSGKLFPNQFVNVRLLVDTLRGVVLAPTSAILRGQNGLFVWAVDPDRTVHQRYVKTGPAAGESTAVTSGLQAGETLVTDGSDRLREGGEVLLPGDCPPPDAGGHGGRRFGGQGAAGGGHRRGQGGASGQGKPGVGPDGQRCTPTAVSSGAGGAQRGQQRMQAMLAQLNLDPAQKSKVDAIVAADQPKMRAAYQSGDMQTATRMRQEMTAGIEAVLRPDQRAKYVQLQQQQRSQFRGGGGPGGALPPATPAPAAPPAPAGGEPSAAQRARGGAPASDLPPAAAPTAASGPRGSLKGPAPADSATNPPAGGAGMAAPPRGGGGRGAGRMQAMLDQLGLDPAQRAKVDAIVAADQPKMRAAYQSGDMAGAGAARQDMTTRIEAVLHPDQRAKYESLRSQMRGQGGGGGPPGGG